MSGWNQNIVYSKVIMKYPAHNSSLSPVIYTKIQFILLSNYHIPQNIIFLKSGLWSTRIVIRRLLRFIKNILSLAEVRVFAGEENRKHSNINIISRYLHGYPWLSLATALYRPLLPAGLKGYIPYRHRAAVCRFELVVLLLHVHVKGSTVVHHLWARPYFSCNVLHVWFV